MTHYRIDRRGDLDDDYGLEFVEEAEPAEFIATPGGALGQGRYKVVALMSHHAGEASPLYVQPYSFSQSALINRTDLEVEKLFEELAPKWRQATLRESSVMARISHPYYTQIIGLGPQAVPHIIREMNRKLDHWFWALASITGTDHASGATSLAEAAERWTNWVQDHGVA